MSKLNKEEKRRLEKLALTEIAEAEIAISMRQELGKKALIKKLNTKVPADVKAKFNKLEALRKEVKAIERWFEKSMYTQVEIARASWSNQWTEQPAHIEVRNGGVRVHSEVAKYDKNTADINDQVKDMEKSFSIQLLDSEDALDLFRQLQADLASLLK